MTLDNGYGTVYRFEIADHIPSGYVVWNIGDHMHDGYIPLTMLKPGTFEIRSDTLKAIALPPDEVALLRKAAAWGIDSKKHAALAAKRRKNPAEVALAKEALEIFKRISE